MYVDSGRLIDLKDLKEEMDDPRTPPLNRRFAFKARKAILKQIHDKHLAHMRERLLKATDKADRYEIWKIRNQIKDYLHEGRHMERNY